HGPLTAPGAVSASEIDTAKHGKYDVPTCFDKPVTKCVVVRGAGRRMLLIGDSHAQVLIPAFSRVARDRGLTLAVASLPNCPWPQGIVADAPLAPKDLDARCHESQNDWYQRIVPQFDPDIVLFIHLPVDQPRHGQGIRDANGHPLPPGDPNFVSTLS